LFLQFHSPFCSAALQVLVSETSPIEFRADAFEQLVLPAATKEIIKRRNENDIMLGDSNAQKVIENPRNVI
jgi:hypothetical protein